MTTNYSISPVRLVSIALTGIERIKRRTLSQKSIRYDQNVSIALTGIESASIAAIQASSAMRRLNRTYWY